MRVSRRIRRRCWPRFFISHSLTIFILFLGTFFCITILCKKLHVQDSAIGALAGVSRIAGCLVFAFAPTRSWFYSAPLFNIFSHTGLTAVRSIATKSVPVEEVGEYTIFNKEVRFWIASKKKIQPIGSIKTKVYLVNLLIISRTNCSNFPKNQSISIYYWRNN